MKGRRDGGGEREREESSAERIDEL